MNFTWCLQHDVWAIDKTMELEAIQSALHKVQNKGSNWPICETFYRPHGKVMFSKASVILFRIDLVATRSLLVLVTAWSVHILLECFLVYNCSHSIKFR